MAVEGTELEVALTFDGQVTSLAAMEDIAKEIANRIVGVEVVTVKPKGSTSPEELVSFRRG